MSQLTLTTTLDEEGTLRLETQVLAVNVLHALGNVTETQALFRFNETAGRFQLIFGDPSAPTIAIDLPTDLNEEKAIALAALILDEVMSAISGDTVNVKIDSGGAGAFIINYT